ncbi:MAG: hypothetical protein K0B16_14915 [Burkholderiaceae bacterium]|nr:hypothetical protein [Burkholderiaceae bacterium]
MSRAALLLALLLALPSTAAELLRPPIAVSGLEMVLPGAVMGGREVSTARFAASGDARQAAESIASAWRAAGTRDVVRRDSGPWQIVSRIVSGKVETIQLRDEDGGTSTGLISRWSLQPVVVRIANHPKRLLPAGATTIEQLVSREGARVVVTTVALSAMAVGELAREVAARARALGFTRRPVMEAARSNGELDVAFYRKSGRRDSAPENDRASVSRAASAGAEARAGAAELVVTIERRAAKSAIVLHLSEEKP